MKFTLEFIISRRLLIPLYIPKNTLVREKYNCYFPWYENISVICFRIDKIRQQYQFTNVSKVYKPVHHKVELNLIDLEPVVEYDK